ncbi:MAG: HAD family phosphatase [Verrucomicrobiota bacterium]|nr:HAD family phosphatase [Verrucomicrobiota bacterium]
MNRWLALDIDGTITKDPHTIPAAILNRLTQFAAEGWHIAFVTGRTLRFARMALSDFKIPHLLIPQNGSGALWMPEERIICKHFLSFSDIAEIEQLLQPANPGLLIYRGFTANDRCYVREGSFPLAMMHEFEKWQEIQKERWIVVPKFRQEEIPEFAVAKCYGQEEEILRLFKAWRGEGKYQITLSRDPWIPGRAMLFISHPLASKGGVLKESLNLMNQKGPVIAAGDDHNDLTLFAVADFRIAMTHAPAELREKADLIVENNGDGLALIRALEKGIQVLS